MLDTAISCIVIKWIFGSSPKMTLFELIGHPLFFLYFEFIYFGVKGVDAVLGVNG